MSFESFKKVFKCKYLLCLIEHFDEKFYVAGIYLTLANFKITFLFKTQVYNII